jgi:hypothetical protein
MVRVNESSDPIQFSRTGYPIVNWSNAEVGRKHLVAILAHTTDTSEALCRNSTVFYGYA